MRRYFVSPGRFGVGGGGGVGVVWVVVSVPDFEETVPAPCRDCKAVCGHPEAANSVVVARQHTCSFGLEDVPDVAGEVVVACTHEAAALGEVDGGDAADDVVVRVEGELLVRPDIEQSASRIVTPSGKRLPIREKVDGVDV